MVSPGHGVNAKLYAIDEGGKNCLIEYGIL
jgi:hypothetical protein